MQDYVRTISNTVVHFLKPQPEELLLNDMFFHLARLPRFNAGTGRFYTVGQHSVLVADQMVGREALVGILHDCAEYVFNDVSSPIVKCCTHYKHMRDNFQDHIYKKFLPKHLLENLEDIETRMKVIDLDMCATEQMKLKSHEPSAGTVIPGVYFENWTFEVCELKLHRAYHRYLELANA